MSLRFRPRVEMLDRRDVPTVTLVEPTSYPLTGAGGSATVVVSVTTEGDGYFHWNYLLHNDSFVYGQDDFWGLGTLRIPVGDTFVTDLDSDIEAEMGLINDPNGGPEDYLASWVFGTEENPGLRPGEAANFSFTTPKVPIGAVGVESMEPGYAGGVWGEALAPAKGVEVDFANATTGQAYKIDIALLNPSGG